MPAGSVHLQLADAILARWPTVPDAGPDDAADPVFREAFRLGAIGPDAGYFPRGSRRLTDLAHYVGTGRLARALVEEARSSTQRGFAWGWVTHLLADSEIHPLINRAAGELVHDDHERPLTYADDHVAHLRVEVGLDAFAHVTAPVRPRRPRHAGPTVEAAELVNRACRTEFHIEVPVHRVDAGHRSAARWTTALLRFDRAQGARFDARDGHREPVTDALLLAARRALGVVMPPGTIGFALTHPVCPSPGLVDALGDALERLPDSFFAHRRSRLAALPDTNLDTGRITGDADVYPPAAATRRWLETQ